MGEPRTWILAFSEHFIKFYVISSWAIIRTPFQRRVHGWLAHMLTVVYCLQRTPSTHTHTEAHKDVSACMCVRRNQLQLQLRLPITRLARLKPKLQTIETKGRQKEAQRKGFHLSFLPHSLPLAASVYVFIVRV